MQRTSWALLCDLGVGDLGCSRAARGKGGHRAATSGRQTATDLAWSDSGSADVACNTVAHNRGIVGARAGNVRGVFNLACRDADV